MSGFRVKRLQKFRYKDTDECNKDNIDLILKEIVYKVINKVSDIPLTANVYLSGYEDGYAKALEKIANIIEDNEKGEFLD